jgi:hypothetical protein
MSRYDPFDAAADPIIQTCLAMPETSIYQNFQNGDVIAGKAAESLFADMGLSLSSGLGIVGKLTFLMNLLVERGVDPVTARALISVALNKPTQEHMDFWADRLHTRIVDKSIMEGKSEEEAKSEYKKRTKRLPYSDVVVSEIYVHSIGSLLQLAYGFSPFDFQLFCKKANQLKESIYDELRRYIRSSERAVANQS